ncbi:hypothetical protein LOK55_04340 [Microbacterium sp. F2E]|uniref:hypothetical protein n=1 Tax=Microbacterium sp. F2E TaxID=2895284 RepID=UPI001E5CCA90|nr:hypothetical protein [Microbacterium sp. F2E]MCC9053538.1 hypothetical protein [Microbacterium sp. F2E]
MSNATPDPQRVPLQPLATWNPTCGVWETAQLDLSQRRQPWSGTWWTSGVTRNGSVYPLPRSAHRIPGSVSSSSPTALFRTPLASDAARGGESLQQVKARRGTIALSHQIIDLALHGPEGHPRAEELESLWGLITEVLDAGDATQTPSPDGNTSLDGQPRRPLS